MAGLQVAANGHSLKRAENSVLQSHEGISPVTEGPSTPSHTKGFTVLPDPISWTPGGHKS